MFLTPEQLHELTGWKQPARQIEWLRDNDYVFDVSRAGRPRVVPEQVVARQCGGSAPRTAGSTPGPNLAWMRD